jgi:DNA-binding NarL/FixJ family response regulator
MERRRTVKQPLCSSPQHRLNREPSNRKEPTMKTHPRRSVLRKIAARRSRTERPAGHASWATFLLGNPPAPEERPVPLALPLAVRILTPREMQVLHLVAMGETDQGIADRLFVSRRTINSHVANILAKLDVPSRRAAVITAARIGLL